MRKPTRMRWFLLPILAFLSPGLLSCSGQGETGLQTSSQDPLGITAPSTAVPFNYFGMHIHKTVDQHYPGFVLTPWPKIPFKSWRLWDTQTTWRQLEPKKGVWRFNMLDQYVALAEEHHVDILMTLGQTPAWASARPTEKTYFPGTAAEPTSLSNWDDYVRTIATRYKGRIHAYEIWNEPNLPMFYSGPVSTMAEMSQRAVAIFKQVDPSITVVSPGITGDPTYLDRYIKAGGLRGVDVVGFHFYVHGQPEDVVAKAAQVKQVLVSNGLSSLPIWNTESGWGDWKDGVNTFTPELAAAFVARANILVWVCGISRFYWYSWDNHSWVKLFLTEPDSTTETPAAQAYRTVEGWMAGNRFHDCRRSSDNFWTCTLTHESRPARIVWAPAGDRSYTPPASWHVSTEIPLSGTPMPLTGKSLTVGIAPVLLY